MYYRLHFNSGNTLCSVRNMTKYGTGESSRRENPSPAQRRLRFNMTMNHTRLRGRIVLLKAYTQLKSIKRKNVHLAAVQHINYLQKAVPLATAISWHIQCNALAVWAWMQWCTWENWPGWAGEENQKKPWYIRCSTKKEYKKMAISLAELPVVGKEQVCTPHTLSYQE